MDLIYRLTFCYEFETQEMLLLTAIVNCERGSIYFYNTRVVTWEPLLEPWRFSIETHLPPMEKRGTWITAASTKGKAEEIKIRSQEDLCINVSHGF